MSFKAVMVKCRGVWGRKDFFSPQADTQTKWTLRGQTEGEKIDAPTHPPFVLPAVCTLLREKTK